MEVGGGEESSDYEEIRKKTVDILRTESTDNPETLWFQAGLDDHFQFEMEQDRQHECIMNFCRAFWEYMVGLDEHARPGETAYQRSVRVFEDKTMGTLSELRQENFHKDPKKTQIKIRERYHYLKRLLMALSSRALDAGLYYRVTAGWDPKEKASEASEEIRLRFGRVAEMLKSQADTLKSHFECFVLRDDQLQNVRSDLALTQHWMQDPTPDNPDDFQTLIMYLIGRAHEQNMRRSGEFVYVMKMTDIEVETENEQGKRVVDTKTVETHAWVQHIELRKFIYRECSRETAPAMWELLFSSRSGGYIERLLTYFEHSSDPLFPKLDRESMRTCWSFQDGVYSGTEDRFYPYAREGLDLLPPPPSLASCKFIPAEFMRRPSLDEDEPDEFNMWETGIPDPGDWYDMPTPALQSIFDSQEFWNASTEPEDREKSHQEVCRMLYALLGRLVFRLGELDKWQVILFIKGIAGSGKSTIGKMVKSWFDPGDVGILSNNVQTQFALADICDKQVFLCFEVKSNFKLDQAELQSMISGEDISVFRKHKSALTKVWDVPGIFFGNESGPWHNSSNSISRRMAVVNFGNAPSAPNPNLDDEIKREAATIILKCVRAYKWCVRTHGPKKDIWDILPPYFKSMQDAMKESTSPITSFLRNCIDLEHGEGENYYVPLQELSQLFRKFCTQNGFDARVTQWNEDMYSTAFKECRPRPLVVEEAERHHDGKMLRTKYVFGVRIVNIGGGGDGLFSMS